MNNEEKSISANEINKYAYCPYQWYYERLYGAAHLRRLYKERNEKLGLNDTVFSNFKSGLDYHASYKPDRGSGFVGRLVRLLMIIAALAGIICGVLYYLYGDSIWILITQFI